MEDEKRGACSTCVHADVDLADPPCAACFKSAIHPAWMPVPKRECETCLYRHAPTTAEPCSKCDGYEFDKWKFHDWAAEPEPTLEELEGIKQAKGFISAIAKIMKESGEMEEKECSTCFWKGRPGILEPCKSCDGYDKWDAGERIEGAEETSYLAGEGKTVYQERIEGLIAAQVKKGREKYGVTLEENVTLTVEQRIEHLEEELIDGLMYCEHMKALRAHKGLTANDYQRAALRTAQVDELSTEELLLNGVMGLCGEAGECIDLVKKSRFQGHELNRDKLMKELGDVAWYLAVTSWALGFDLADVLEANVEKLKERYPDGFDKARSMNRPE